MTQKAKIRTKRSVATVQQTIKPGVDTSKLIAIDLMAYIGRTELPILSEYAAENILTEEFLVGLAGKCENMSLALKILETKKRAALERKIYIGELNATIGGQLLKSWREQPQSTEPAKYREISLQQMFEAGFTDYEIAIYSDIVRKFDRSASSTQD